MTHKTIKYKGWSAIPSGDGKRYFIQSPDCDTVFEVDADDYTNSTFPDIRNLLRILGNHWDSKQAEPGADFQFASLTTR